MNIPQQAIEAAARAVYQLEVDEAADVGVTFKSWERLPEACQATHTDTATAALEAAAPHLATPRTITTREEIDALPDGSVIIVRNIAERYRAKAKALGELPGLTLIPFTLAVAVLAAATYGHHLNRKRSK